MEGAAPVVSRDHLKLLALLCVSPVVLWLAAEVTARVDDRIRHDVPVLASPERERELTLHDEFGVRGRPHGVFKKWRLNAFGFRGPRLRASRVPAVHG